MNEDRPAWARRMTNEREARNWSQADAVTGDASARAKDETLPDDASLLRQWKRWEAGEVMPGEFYQPIIARDLRHSHPRDVPGAAQARRRHRDRWRSAGWTPWSWSAGCSARTWTTPR